MISSHLSLSLSLSLSQLVRGFLRHGVRQEVMLVLFRSVECGWRYGEKKNWKAW